MNTYQQIFEIACEELPHKHFNFFEEEAVLYKGFKSSKRLKQYFWQDIRFSDYYAPVDSLITQNIIQQGFTRTLTQVFLHNNDSRIEQIHRDIHHLKMQMDYWIKKSSDNWHTIKNGGRRYYER